MSENTLSLDKENKLILGVCAGLARKKNRSILWVRLVYVLLAFFYGVGLFLYVLRYMQSEDFKNQLGKAKGVIDDRASGGARGEAASEDDTQPGVSDGTEAGPSQEPAREKSKPSAKGKKKQCDLCGDKVGGLMGKADVANYIPEEFRDGHEVVCSNCAKKISITCSVCGREWSVDRDAGVFECPTCLAEEQRAERKARIKRRIAEYRSKYLKRTEDEFEDLVKLEVRDFTKWQAKSKNGVYTWEWNASLKGEIRDGVGASFLTFREFVVDVPLKLQVDEDLVLQSQSSGAVAVLPFMQFSPDEGTMDRINSGTFTYYLSLENMQKIMDTGEALYTVAGDTSLHIDLEHLQSLVGMWMAEMQGTPEIDGQTLHRRQWVLSSSTDDGGRIDRVTLFTNNEALKTVLSISVLLTPENQIGAVSMDVMYQFLNVGALSENTNKAKLLVKIGGYKQTLTLANFNTVAPNLRSVQAVLDRDTLDRIGELTVGKDLKIRLDDGAGGNRDWTFPVGERSKEKIDFLFQDYFAPSTPESV